MSKTKTFLLQSTVVLLASLIPALIVWRAYPSPQRIRQVYAQTDPVSPPSQEEETVVAEEEPRTSPNFVSIPSIGLALPVAAGVISENQWTLYDDRVSWLSTSAVPGGGNVILYAHNRPHLFGGLHEVGVGDQIFLEREGWEYLYEVVEVRKVTPDDVGAILSEQDQLTLYTCDGTFDQRRLVVIAHPR